MHSFRKACFRRGRSLNHVWRRVNSASASSLLSGCCCCCKQCVELDVVGCCGCVAICIGSVEVSEAPSGVFDSEDTRLGVCIDTGRSCCCFWPRGDGVSPVAMVCSLVAPRSLCNAACLAALCNGWRVEDSGVLFVHWVRTCGRSPGVSLGSGYTNRLLGVGGVATRGAADAGSQWGSATGAG